MMKLRGAVLSGEVTVVMVCKIVDVSGILLTMNPSLIYHKHHDHVMRFEPGLQTTMACSPNSCVSQAVHPIVMYHKRVLQG